MRTGLSQKQLQIQKLSPQQIQLMKLLQVPTALLEQRIKEEIEENPALEEGENIVEADTQDQDPEESVESEIESEDEPEIDDEMEVVDYIQEYLDNEDDTPDYKLQGDGYNPDEEEKSMPVVLENSFYDFLVQQIGLSTFSNEKERIIARQIIGSIDEDGYLRRDTFALVDDLIFSLNIIVTEFEIEEVLKKVQRFDPPGIGARDLQECLLIQLALRIEQTGKESQTKDALILAYKMVDKYFDAFSKKHYEKLLRSLNISEKQLKQAVEEVLKLNPKPSSGYIGDAKSSNNQYIIPDFIITNRDEELEVVLHSRNAPELRISDHFREMLRTYGVDKTKGLSAQSDKEAVKFIRQKIESARWFIDAIRQRHETMYRTMYAILEYQYEFFLTGDQKKLKPMILQDISTATGLDVSTISRVANSKYVQTEFGTKRLKEFFSESMQMSDGEEVSTIEVKKILAELIVGEDKKLPLSDDKLTQILGEKGYPIARRTVAKYRDQLNIAKASLRKEL
jgi:RNA polymerase sigma-54 factor